MKYQQHPLSAAWPALSDDEFKRLVESVNAFGVLDKIVVYDEMILDGWHRYKACMELNVKKPPMVEYEGDDPAGFVISKNDARRHADVSQRAFSVAKMIDLYDESGRSSHYMEQIKSSKFARLSIPKAAELAGVSTRTMIAAKAAIHAVQEVQDAVMSGEMAVSEAAKLSKLPEDDQREAVRAPKAKPAKEPKPRAEESVALSELQALQDKFDELASNYQALASELDACEAIRNGEQMDHFKKLNQQLIAVTASRDEWQNKCGELTRQVNYLNAKLKKQK